MPSANTWKDTGKKDFHLMGYDLLQRNVDCLRKGSIDFIIAQQPTLQGYSSIESLCNHLILKKRDKSMQLHAHQFAKHRKH